MRKKPLQRVLSVYTNSENALAGPQLIEVSPVGSVTKSAGRPLSELAG